MRVDEAKTLGELVDFLMPPNVIIGGFPLSKEAGGIGTICNAVAQGLHFLEEVRISGYDYDVKIFRIPEDYISIEIFAPIRYDYNKLKSFVHRFFGVEKMKNPNINPIYKKLDETTWRYSENIGRGYLVTIVGSSDKKTESSLDIPVEALVIEQKDGIQIETSGRNGYLMRQMFEYLHNFSGLSPVKIKFDEAAALKDDIKFAGQALLLAPLLVGAVLISPFYHGRD